MGNGKVIFETNTHDEPVHVVDMSSQGEAMREIAGDIADGAHKKALEWIGQGRNEEALRLVQYVAEVATAVRMIKVNHLAEVQHPEVSEDLPGMEVVLGRNGKFRLELPPQAHSAAQLLSTDPHIEAAAEIIDAVLRAKLPALTTQMEQSASSRLASAKRR